MKDEKVGRKTSPGFADPLAVVRMETPVSIPRPGSIPVERPSQSPDAPARRSNRARPLIDVDVVHERSRVPRPAPFPGCYEVWTQNNVYAVDSRMRCVEVRERATGNVKLEHPFLGARLVGGQYQDDAMEMSYPLPRPGSFAVFELKKRGRRQFTRTSAVERVVLRMRIVTIADGSIAPAWDAFAEQDD